MLQLFATTWDQEWGPGSCQLPMVLGGAFFEREKKETAILKLEVTRICCEAE